MSDHPIYCCLSKNVFIFEKFHLVPFRKEDLFLIKEWRNAQIPVLRQKKHLTDQEQLLYWKQAIVPSFQEKYPSQILFSFLHEQSLIGYGGLTHLDFKNSRAEVSFLLNPLYKEESPFYAKSFSVFLKLLQEVAFSTLSLHRLFTETYDTRPFHVALLEKAGFILEGRLKDHVKREDRFIDSLIHGKIQ